MQLNPNLVPVLVLFALATAQRANAGLGCSGRALKDETKCWVDDIKRVFGGSQMECDNGSDGSDSDNGWVSVRS